MSLLLDAQRVRDERSYLGRGNWLTTEYLRCVARRAKQFLRDAAGAETIEETIIRRLVTAGLVAAGYLRQKIPHDPRGTSTFGCHRRATCSHIYTRGSRNPRWDDLSLPLLCFYPWHGLSSAVEAHESGSLNSTPTLQHTLAARNVPRRCDVTRILRSHFPRRRVDIIFDTAGLSLFFRRSIETMTHCIRQRNV